MRKQRVDTFKYYDLIVYAARGSHSARRLASALGCRRWRDDLPERYTRRRPYFRRSTTPVVCNWGSTRPALWLSDARFRLRPIWINSAEACSAAIDKQKFFRLLSGRDDISILRACEDRETAGEWLKKGYGVVARKTTTGSSGHGIVVVQPGNELPNAPLYTRYYPKTHEFRAHVWKGEVIDFTQKRLKGGPNEAANRTVRSLANGWIHAHELEVQEPAIKAMGTGAVACIGALGLDFGSVDILACLSSDRQLTSFRICEVNTGPGLENTVTIDAYAKALLKTYEETKQ